MLREREDSTMNAYCEALGIAVPSVENVAQRRDVSSYSLLIAVLLERGGPATLEEAAQRIAAGVGDARSVPDSPKRCRPSSAPATPPERCRPARVPRPS